MILDIFSRKTLRQLVATRESAALAEQLITATIRAQNVPAGQLTLHADRGTSMASKPVALLLADLSATKTHNRPRVNNDNPYSQAQSNTLKYSPNSPKRSPPPPKPRRSPPPSSTPTTSIIATPTSAR